MFKIEVSFASLQNKVQSEGKLQNWKILKGSLQLNFYYMERGDGEGENGGEIHTNID